MTRISSKAYRDGARDMRCLFNMPGCAGGGDDTVFCHLHDEHAGGAIKSSDLSGADGCQWCHDRMDRRAKMPNGDLISHEDWLFYAFRALQRTIERRVNQGLLTLPADAEETRRTSSAKPGKIAGRPMPKSSRKIPSRPMRAK